MGPIFAIVLSLLAIFLILLVLVQRGRGGGLAGALGGMGGSSAFGAKAGDVFTRITVITASIWIAFCLFALFWAKHKGDVLGAAPVASSAEIETGMPSAQKGAPPTGTAATGEPKSVPAGGAAAPASPPAAATTTPPAASPATPPAAAPAATTPPASPPANESK